jgi:hypothetical protein
VRRHKLTHLHARSQPTSRRLRSQRYNEGPWRPKFTFGDRRSMSALKRIRH